MNDGRFVTLSLEVHLCQNLEEKKKKRQITDGLDAMMIQIDHGLHF